MPHPMTDKPNLARLLDGVPRHYDGNAERVMLEADVLAALSAALPDLNDPVTVHVNMLRGTIAKPTVEQIVHLYGREAFQPMIDAAVAKALEDACLAVSEHADWPEDEHGRTDQVGLFSQVINAILAITPARATHVNETPKSEHDGADVLKALPPDVAGVVEEAGKVAERLAIFRTAWGELPSIAPHIETAPGVTTGTVIGTCGDAASTIRALIALATAQAAQISGLEATIRKFQTVHSVDTEADK